MRTAPSYASVHLQNPPRAGRFLLQAVGRESEEDVARNREGAGGPPVEAAYAAIADRTRSLPPDPGCPTVDVPSVSCRDQGSKVADGILGGL